MRLSVPLLIAFTVSISGARSADEVHYPVLPLNSLLPVFELPGVDGQIHRSSDIDSKVLVIVFTCNHCPTAELYENRIKALAAGYAPKGVTLVAIQPNNPKAIRLDELGYTDVGDSFPEMKIRAAYRHFNFPYLYDGDTQDVARAFGPSATPHVFVFDSRRRLRYEGRIDDSVRENLVTRHDTRDAIDAVLAGRPVLTPRTPSFGCSTKWSFKEEGRNEESEEQAKEPISVTEVDAADLVKLKQNTGDKVTLVDFWATWCGPCVQEMPELVKTWHMYRRRPFDLVTVSVNYPDEKKGVLTELQRDHIAARNFLFGSNKMYPLMHAFDPDWDASIPFASLLAPDGKVIWKAQGETSILALRRRILANLPDDDYAGQRAYWNSAQ